GPSSWLGSARAVAERAVTTDAHRSPKWPANIAWLREHEFPLAAKWAYVNHAASGPLPASHVRAAQTFLEHSSTAPPRTSLADYGHKADEVRRLAAALFRCRPGDIAILPSTTKALALVPLALDWRSGDEVVLYEREFPNLVFPWLQLRKKGV